MANDVGEAIGTIAGMILAGFLLLSIAQNMETTTPGNFEVWGRFLIYIGIGTGILVFLAILNTILN
ncbi:MAG: hypothetical protein U5J98_02400 [Halobacteriales archaeon]|nr:hypothetical protein [Halobacteriales archaeon]